jgi:uncharacterized protein
MPPHSRVFRVALLLFVLGVAGCASPSYRLGTLAEFEQAHIFQPLKYPGGNWDPDGLPHEDAWFVAADGTKLHGWYCPHDNPVAYALFAHGNAGNVSSQAGMLRLLRDRHRLAVLTFDYRGYGRSAGEPTEAGILQDARAARAWLAEREHIAETDIVLIGQSLGGGVAVDLAAADGARGLVLANTFTSLPDAASHFMPLVPTRLLMQNRLDSFSKIGNYRGPLWQVHGDRDRIIPYRLGRRLFNAANEPKQFVTNRGGDHNDPLSEENVESLDRFLASLPR